MDPDLDHSDRPLILYVDDERLMLSAFRRTVRKEPYEVIIANSGSEGLEVIATRDVAVVVSDARMPNMDGVEFLRRVAKASPDTMRMLLTGYTDQQTTVDAINEAGVYRYLSKPWRRDDLLQALRDAVETRALRLGVRSALATAESANRSKSEFLANMSHELRTPLHAVLSFSRLAKKRLPSGDLARQDRYLSKITTNAELLLQLVNDLLDLSKLDAGAVVLSPVQETLEHLVCTELEALTALFEEKSVQVDLKVHANAEVHVDPEQFAKVLRNLIGNALKYCPVGERVTIEIDAQGELASVSISDTGPGVDEEDLELIFQKFVQAKKTNNGAGGTGLGLAIAKEIVVAHSGSIHAANNPDGGLRVRVDLPLAFSNESERCAAAS